VEGARVERGWVERGCCGYGASSFGGVKKMSRKNGGWL
jgi:hypothetical protein